MVDSLIILSYIGISQVLFASVLMLTKRPVMLHDKIMVAWLLVIALRFWLVANGVAHTPFFDISFSEALIPLTFGPFLYLYCKYLISDDEKIVLKDYIHFLPFVVLFFLGILNNIIPDEKYDMDYEISLNLVYLLSTIIYASLVFVLLAKYRKSIKFNFFSYDSASNRLFWLNYVAILAVFSLSLYVVYTIFYANQPDAKYNLFTISTATMVLLVFSVSYFGFTQQSVTQKRKEIEHYGFRNMLSDLIEKVFNFNTRSNILVEQATEKEETSPQKLEQIEALKKVMQSSKPYLNPELTLQDLADSIDIPKHQLTNLFNVHMGLNFFEFVNGYRIDEAKERLLDPQYENFTIIAIAFDCGFNSKSTFNTLFREKTGLTPRQFRNQSSNDSNKA